MAQSPSGIGASIAAPPSSQPQTRFQMEVGSWGAETEFSIFVGDLSELCREKATSPWAAADEIEVLS